MNKIKKLWHRRTAPESPFDASFALTMLALRWAGIDTAQTEYRGGVKVVKITYKFCLHVVLLILMYSAEAEWIIDGVLQQKTMGELTAVASYLVYGVMIIIKTCNLVRNGRFMLELLKGLVEMYPNVEAVAKDERRTINGIVRDSMTFSNRVVRILFYLHCALVVCFAVQPMFLLALGYFRSGDVNLTLPLPVNYPFDQLNPLYWPFVFVQQTYGGSQAVFHLVGADTFFYVSCAHIHMNFKILMHQFENLDFSSDHQENGCAELRKVIRKHQELIRCVELLETLYTQSNFVNYISSSFLICWCGFNIVMVNDVWLRLKCIIFLSSNIAQICMLCYFGDMISSSSSDVVTALCNSRWYEGTLSDQKTMLIVATRSHKACTLTAINYVPVNLQTFTDILKTAWSYFSLLQSVSIDDTAE